MTSSAQLQPLSLEVSWFSIKFVPARFSYSLKAASKSDLISGVCVEDIMQADTARQCVVVYVYGYCQ